MRPACGRDALGLVASTNVSRRPVFFVLSAQDATEGEEHSTHRDRLDGQSLRSGVAPVMTQTTLIQGCGSVVIVS